jgi:ABC-type glutathione transport system ATPase component
LSVALLEPQSPAARETSASPGAENRRRSRSRTNPAPHNIGDEEPPEDRFHEAAFQQAFHDSKTVMSEVADVLETSDIHLAPDSVMQQLHRKVKELANFRCPSTRTVGFVGDSGVGRCTDWDPWYSGYLVPCKTLISHLSRKK